MCTVTVTIHQPPTPTQGKFPVAQKSTIQYCYKSHGIPTSEFFQVNTAVKTDASQSQYIELGDLSYACITIPNSCGSQGGTASAWIKLITCASGGSAMVTSFSQVQSNFGLACGSNIIRYTSLWFSQIRQPQNLVHVLSHDLVAPT